MLHLVVNVQSQITLDNLEKHLMTSFLVKSIVAPCSSVLILDINVSMDSHRSLIDLSLNTKMIAQCPVSIVF